MKLTTLPLLALSASFIHARFVEENEIDQVLLQPEIQEIRAVEIKPGHIVHITEEEKWDLKRVCHPTCFMVIV